MERVKTIILDPTGKEQVFYLSIDNPVENFIPTLVALVGLSKAYDSSSSNSYVLINERTGHRFEGTDTLATGGVEPEDRLILMEKKSDPSRLPIMLVQERILTDLEETRAKVNLYLSIATFFWGGILGVIVNLATTNQTNETGVAESPDLPQSVVIVLIVCLILALVASYFAWDSSREASRARKTIMASERITASVVLSR